MAVAALREQDFSAEARPACPTRGRGLTAENRRRKDVIRIDQDDVRRGVELGVQRCRQVEGNPSHLDFPRPELRMNAGELSPWTVTARWVFPVSGPPLERGTITVEG